MAYLCTYDAVVYDEYPQIYDDTDVHYHIWKHHILCHKMLGEIFSMTMPMRRQEDPTLFIASHVFS